MKFSTAMRKVARFSALSAMTLATFVACGEGFKAKSIEDILVKTSGNISGQGATYFQPSVHLNKAYSGDRYSQSFQLYFDIVDGTRKISLSTAHLAQAGYSNSDAQTVDGVRYELNAICADASCNSIGATITRSDSVTRTTEQSAAYERDDGSGINRFVTTLRHGTQYTSAENALQVLSGGANPDYH